MNEEDLNWSIRMTKLETQVERLVSDVESEKRTRAEANRTLREEILDLKDENNARFDKVAEKQEKNREAIMEGQMQTNRIIYISAGILGTVEFLSKFVH